MSDEAKAAEEIAKAAQPITKALGQLVGDLLGPAFKEYGLAWGDRVGAWRERNATRTLEGVAVKMGDRQMEGRTLPPRFLLPALEKASAVDEPELQDLWAELIANGVAVEENQQPRYIQTLAGLSADDAKVFEDYVRADAAAMFVRRGKVGGSWWEQNLTGERLRSLGLLEVAGNKPEPQPVRDAAGNVKVMSLGHVDYPFRVSNYGRQFAGAVGIVPRETMESPK